MLVANTKDVLSAMAGMLAGYVVWAAGGALITSTLPVHLWGDAAALFLPGMTAAALVARRHRHGPSATALLWSPVLPLLASIFLLISFAA